MKLSPFISLYHVGRTQRPEGRTMASLTTSGLWGIGKRSISCPKIPSYQFKSPSFGARSRSVCQTQRWAVKASTSGSGSPSPGLYSAKLFDLTPQNVDMVLEDVRPYLIADGGNVDVVSVDDGVISLKLQGFLFIGFVYSFVFYILIESIALVFHSSISQKSKQFHFYDTCILSFAVNWGFFLSLGFVWKARERKK